MSRIRTLFIAARAVGRTYGMRGVVRRGRHELRRKLRMFSAAPTGSLGNEFGTPSPWYALSNDWDAVPAARRTELIERGQRVVGGEYEAFGAEWRRMPVSPVEWRTHFSTRYEFSNDLWWTVPHLPAEADIKDVWEPARFAWVYDLIRAYRLTGDETFATAFYKHLQRWMESSHPFRGVHWSCGQETAIRALAILHAEAAMPALRDAEAAGRIASVLLWSAERIADAIGYGASQRNNHGISEAAGLIHLGLRFRRVDRRARNWLSRGQRIIEEQIRDQFALDGWYAQHSFNYMRVALDQVLLVQRALEANGATLSEDALRRIDAALSLLTELVDGVSGVVPNHGANDGARVLPLSAAPHRDYRPLLTLGAVIRRHAMPADVPPDRETLAWLGAPTPAIAEPRRDRVIRGASGFVIARLGDVCVFLRAGEYRHRPSHLDVLHLDVRFGSQEVVVDPGTFAYNAPPPWNNGLVSAVVHNGPVVDDTEPAQRGARFLWYSWPVARVRRAELLMGMVQIVAEVPGIAVRTVEIRRDRVTVSDELTSTRNGAMQVTWLLHPSITGPERVIGGEYLTAVIASDDAADAWFSPTYGVRLACTAVRARIDGDAPRRRLETVIMRPTSAAEVT
jgi:hypothetical protein